MPSTNPQHPSELSIHAKLTPQLQQVLSPDALNFLQELVVKFAPALRQLLNTRKQRQSEYDSGSVPNFLAETKVIRSGDWKIKNIPTDLMDRRVEITGPADRKMVINALNSNVKTFMADFEDSLSPTWENLIQGQINLRDAVNRSITYDDPRSGKHYKLNDNPAVLICRPRGLHLPERHITYNDAPIPASLFDFALYFYLNYQTLLDNQSGPYFYLPKLESHLEARRWNEVLNYAEQKFNLPIGTIKVTVLIETLPAAFEMDEILYELRDHIVGLNCGRWDYIFSYIKTLRTHGDRILPDRQTVTMDKSFLNAYSRLLIKTCHKRGALAIGGMAAFIPSKSATDNASIFEKVKNDKILEASNGHDGTWIAHPGLAAIAMQVFDEYIPKDKPNQLHVLRENDSAISDAELLQPCEGECTEEGLRHNIRVAVQYIAAWLSGNGCVPIYGLMEDAATAEISRTSIWQWMQHQVTLDNGQQMNRQLFQDYLQQETEALKKEVGAESFARGNYLSAAKLFESITLNK